MTYATQEQINAWYKSGNTIQTVEPASTLILEKQPEAPEQRYSVYKVKPVDALKMIGSNMDTRI